jgi:hypothetical protein
VQFTLRFLLFLPVFIVVAKAGEVRSGAVPYKVPFSLPDSPPLTVALVLPAAKCLVAHYQTERGDLIQARVGGDDGPGMLVEVRDEQGRKLWSHDFGYNLSASEGNRVEVSYSAALRLLLVEYSGYKWDHQHKLLFVVPGKTQWAVREYRTADADLLPFLRRQKGFAADHEYFIYPCRLVERGVEFECVPLQKPERGFAHPFAQHQTWFSVTTTIGAKRKIVPVSAAVSHGEN